MNSPTASQAYELMRKLSKWLLEAEHGTLQLRVSNYDEAECDAFCLADDLRIEFEEEEE